jgi:general secretion pathway protein B
MSMILEALKKSEAQRQLGEMPNLGTPITATRPRHNPLPRVAFTLIFVLGAAGGWWYLYQPAPPIPAPAADAQTPIRVIAKPEPVLFRAPASQAPLTATPAPAATVPPPKPATAAPVAQKEIASAPAPAQTLPAPASAEAAPAPTHAPSTVSDVPMVADMPADVRSALPALPIMMQVYSPDPKSRFVVIDGTRVEEGDSVRGVTVQEIRPTGLVLDFHGQRMLLPRPGS